MTATLERDPLTLGPRHDDGGAPARRAVVRWAWRLFRREWRQQVLVLALIIVAVGATTVGVALATNANPVAQTTMTLSPTDPQLAADLAAIQTKYPGAVAFVHQIVPIPGSVAAADLRAPLSGPVQNNKLLQLLAGRYPTAPNEVAMTRQTADEYGLSLGATWHVARHALTLVGFVRNPVDYNDQFAMVTAGEASPATSATIEFLAAPRDLSSLPLPSHNALDISSTGHSSEVLIAITVLALATLGLIFVGLVAVAGFTVMAQRRLRALGMLESLGATDKHVRLVLIANGAAVGVVGAVIGAIAGLAGWFALAPTIESLGAHRIDPLHVPWWAVGMAIALAIVMALAASWWPARTASRIPIVAALSGRPPRPQPAHRFAAVGGGLVGLGVLLLIWSHQDRPVQVIIGTLLTAVGMLFLAPLAIRVLAFAGQRAPIAVRLAFRDLARYHARSGAALGAVTLAIGISATICVSATAVQGTNDASSGGGNLPANQLIVYLSPNGYGSPVPTPTPTQLASATTSVHSILAALGTANVLPLDVAFNPTDPLDLSGPPGVMPADLLQVHGALQAGGGSVRCCGSAPAGAGGPGGPKGGFEANLVSSLYVATPAVLEHYGITPSQINPNADVLSSLKPVANLRMSTALKTFVTPNIQRVNLPTYSSDPNSLLTIHAVQANGLDVTPAAWLLQTARPLTHAQIDDAQRLAGGGGLTVETRPTQSSSRGLTEGATGAGILLALGVLAMTVGLIRSETANDLRTLTAAGAGSATRRTLTGATAGALAFLGALLGIAGAYASLLAFHHNNLHSLTHVPYANLAFLLAGMPLAALVGGLLLAGREPPVIARRPIE